MKTYQNEQYGFEIDIPEDWAPASGRPPLWALVPLWLKMGWIPSVNVQFTSANESFNISIEAMTPEPPPDITELLLALQAPDMGYANLEFGRISIQDREHTWARYVFADKVWSKKYLVVLGGRGYAMTAACNDEKLFTQREAIWDAVASSFRLLAPIDDSIRTPNESSRAYRTTARLRETLELRAERRAWNLSYGRALEAIEDHRYADARTWLEKCLEEYSEGPRDTQLLLLSTIVPVLKKLGDKKGLLHCRREVKRLDPSDRANRSELVELLVGFGYRKEAMRELDEFIALEPENSSLQNRRIGLTYGTRLSYRLKFALSVAYFLAVDMIVLALGSLHQISWIVGPLCVPAAHYLDLSGRWIGLTRKTSDWMTIAFSLSTLTILVIRGGLHVILFIFLTGFVYPILKDNALRD